MPDPKVITVRLSPELHQAFRELAYDRRTSMNQLAVNLLAQAVGEQPASTALPPCGSTHQEAPLPDGI